ncbi:hypothetical protein FB451DRAFT_1408786 [Mycena latifolia]|nr:hypothetical protein FB451DRAFT_1408786 [Mycena latifolia]
MPYSLSSIAPIHSSGVPLQSILPSPLLNPPSFPSLGRLTLRHLPCLSSPPAPACIRRSKDNDSDGIAHHTSLHLLRSTRIHVRLLINHPRIVPSASSPLHFVISLCYSRLALRPITPLFPSPSNPLHYTVPVFSCRLSRRRTPAPPCLITFGPAFSTTVILASLFLSSSCCLHAHIPPCVPYHTPDIAPWRRLSHSRYRTLAH